MAGRAGVSFPKWVLMILRDDTQQRWLCKSDRMQGGLAQGQAAEGVLEVGEDELGRALRGSSGFVGVCRG